MKIVVVISNEDGRFVKAYTDVVERVDVSFLPESDYSNHVKELHEIPVEPPEDI